MMRRYPVRSVLSERKMFSNGGMLPTSKPVESSMNQPSGILASSSPLIDAVSQEILAPFTGSAAAGAMPMTGAMPMAQGGVASISNLLELNPIPRVGKREKIGLGATPEAMEERALQGPGELVKSMFPREASLTGGRYGGQLLRPSGSEQEEVSINPGAGDILGVAASIPSAAVSFLDQAARGLSQINQFAGETLLDFGETALGVALGEKPKGADLTSYYGQVNAVNDALRRAPKVQDVSDEQLGLEINNLAKIAIADSPNITGELLSQIIAEGIYKKYEEPNVEKYQANDFNFEDKDFIIDDNVPPDGSTAPAANPVAAPAANPVAAAAQADNVALDLEEEVMVSDKSVPIIEDFYGQNKKLLESISKPNMSEKDATKTIADYKQKFMDQMPEYEGMSESEKGFALMEAGLRVAAGESPNAITNVAKGLKGLGATFAKDEKEKRAWSRQVELSASKYGLQRVAKDTAELRADAKADRNLYTKVFRVRPGQTFERNGEVLPENSTVILKVGEIKDGTVDLNKLQTEDSISAQLKTYNNKLKLQLKGLKDNTIKPDKFEATKKAYLKDSSQVRTNVAVTGYLKNALAALNTKDVTGFRGAGKDIILKIGNATGLKEFSEKAFGKLTTKAQYQRFTEGATTKFIEGLISEGGKISDFERDLARELSGAIGTRLYSGITADTQVLTGKIKSFISDLNASSDLSLRSMAISENTWSTSYNTTDIDLRKEIGSYGQILKDSRRPLAGKSTAIPKGTILWKDIMEVDAAGKPLGLNKVFKRTLK